MGGDEDDVIELTETGGVVGVPLRYAVRLADLAPPLRELAESLARSAPARAAEATLPGADRTVGELRLLRAGRETKVSTSSVEPDDLERLLGAIRAHPVKRRAES